MAEITIIMPAYNAENTIDHSIQSVCEQTFDDWELIIVNDGSTDDTEGKVFAWQKKEPRIRYLYQPNQGVSAARNAGINQATGKYISFLDADDIWMPEALNTLYSYIENHPDVKFVYGKTEEIFCDGTHELVGPAAHDGYLEDFIHKNNELRLTYHISAILIDLSMIRDYEIHFETGIKVSEDTGFFIELMCVTKAYGLNVVLSKYLRRNGSATGKEEWKPEDWYGQVGIYFCINDFVEKYRPTALLAFHRMRNFVCYRYVLRCVRNGYVKEAQQYISEWDKYLREFVRGDGKINDKIKCWFMMRFISSPKFLWLLGRM